MDSVLRENPVETLRFDVVVVGGGLAGVVAAIQAARLGAQTALLHDRPVLGGNSSSEVRVSPVGADFNNRYARETGILEELRMELKVRDTAALPWGTGRPVPIWDAVLWDWVRREPALTLFLNTRARAVEMKAPRIIAAIIGDQLTTEKAFRLQGKVFIDCTGDGQVGVLAGAPYMIGRESRTEFGESRALDESDDMVMSPTLTFSAHDVGHPVAFEPPAWAHRFDSCDALPHRFHARKDYGYWWIEFGGELDTIGDSEKIRDELLRIVYGVWDHIKNHCDGSAENYALDFVGAVLGKRESRRFIGDHILTQQDLESQILFADRVAYGGWPLDHLHPPGGVFSPDPPGNSPQRHYLMRTTGREYLQGTVVKHLYGTPPAHWPEYLPPLPGLYSIPLRSLYSKAIENLLFAGRNVSATHIALGSLRVQGTTAAMGQAAGAAAAMCALHQLTPRDIVQHHLAALQQTLLREDAYIIECPNKDPEDLALRATLTASSEAEFSGAMRSGFDAIDGLAGESGKAMPAKQAGSYSYGYREHVEEGNPLRPEEERWLLDVPRAQMFYHGGGRLDSINLLMRNRASEVRRIVASLRMAHVLGTFDDSEQPLAKADAVLPPDSGPRWVKLSFGYVMPQGLYWVEIPDTADVIWLQADENPIGTYRGAWFPEYSRWDRLLGTHAFYITPPAFRYSANSATNGVSRPEAGPNIWISDPREVLPQWLQLEWPKEERIGYVQLTFDTDLDAMVQLGFVKPGPVAPCVRDYAIQCMERRGWRTVVEVRGNYQRARRHSFRPISTKQLRVVVWATNGGRSARIYEIRAYSAKPSLMTGKWT